MESKLKLTLEQEFSLTNIRKSMDNASADDLRDIIISLMRQMYAKDNLYKEMIKETWNLTSF